MKLTAKQKRLVTWLLRLLALVPLVMGTIGFLRLGKSFPYSIYGSFCMYFVSVWSDAQDPFLNFARWTAPIVTATGILYTLKRFLYRTRNWFISLRKGSTAIYYDEGEAEHANLLLDSVPRAFLEKLSPEKPWALYPKADNQVLLFSDDFRGLNFLENHPELQENAQVYLKLNQVDSYLLKESNTQYFNETESLATMFWRNHSLLKEVGEKIGPNAPTTEEGTQAPLKIQVAIIGDGDLPEWMLKVGLLVNIFTLDQEITYHMFWNNTSFENLYPNLNLMNRDRIVYHHEDWHTQYELLGDMDRVIFTDPDAITNVENMMYKVPAVDLYVYSPLNIDFTRFFNASNHITCFGQQEKLYTRDMIMGGDLYTVGKKLNYITINPDVKKEPPETRLRRMEEEWAKLDGFTKASYTAIADFSKVIFGMMSVMRPDVDDDILNLDSTTFNPKTLAVLEHTRWCRFYFLNHWKYGEPENNELRDPALKIHRSLVPYEELNAEDRKREFNRVKFLLKSEIMQRQMDTPMAL